jgi:putative transcriptional regulator
LTKYLISGILIGKIGGIMASVKINLDPLIANKVITEGRSITLKEVSQKTGISENRLVDFRKGRARAIKLKTITSLCDYFGCTPGDLIILMNKADNQQ